jgi:hypothetical protein
MFQWSEPSGRIELSARQYRVAIDRGAIVLIHAGGLHVYWANIVHKGGGDEGTGFWRAVMLVPTWFRR